MYTYNGIFIDVNNKNIINRWYTTSNKDDLNSSIAINLNSGDIVPLDIWWYNNGTAAAMHFYTNVNQSYWELISRNNLLTTNTIPAGSSLDFVSSQTISSSLSCNTASGYTSTGSNITYSCPTRNNLTIQGCGPAYYNDIGLWLEAKDNTYNSFGSNLSNITTWKDLSKNKISFTASNPVSQSASAINSKPALNLDGSQNFSNNNITKDQIICKTLK